MSIHLHILHFACIDVLLDGLQSAFIVYVSTYASMEFKYINLLLDGLQSVVIVRVGTLFL